MTLNGLFTLNSAYCYALLGVFVLIFVNFVLGVVVALLNGTFSFSLFPQFLDHDVLPYGLTLSILVAAAQFDFSSLARLISANGTIFSADFFKTLAITGLATVAAKFIAAITSKVNTILGYNVGVEKMAALKKAGGFARLSALFVMLALVIVVMLILLL